MTKLLELYIPLVGLVWTGFILGSKLPATVPTRLGQFLFWVGVPLSVIAFLRKADLSGQVWIAPVVAWVAILLGVALAWGGIKVQAYWYKSVTQPPSQGSLILAAMVGNTGYIGYPVTLAIVGQEYFAWALFFDLLGTTLGAYGLGVAIASIYGDTNQPGQLTKAILINPTLWGFGCGLLLRHQPLPPLASWCLDTFAWTALAFALILIGMRLSKLTSWQHLPQASISISIKMLLVPLLVGSSLPWFGITGATALVMVLQMAMPPAFATLVLAEAFHLDKELTVTALAAGTAALLLTLPLWLLIF